MYNNAFRFIFLILFVCFSISSADAQKRAYKRAMRFYQAKNYSEALVEFEKSLDGRTNISTLSKMAYCYRMNNDMLNAHAIYDTIVHHERIKPKAFFYYAETLITQNKYDEAKQWFSKYIEDVPKDSAALLMVENCDRLKLIKPVLPKINLTFYEHNSDADDTDAAFWDGGIVFSSDRKILTKFLKETSGWTGREFLYLYHSKNQGDTLMSAPEFMSKPFNFVSKNNSNLTSRRDSSEVYICRNSDKENKKGYQGLSIYRALANTQKTDFEKMKTLNFCNPEFNFFHPTLSPDGQFLYYTSDKRRGEGGTDIWFSQRDGDRWTKPENMGSQINTAYNEGFPYALTNDILLFCSKGHAGYGGFDIFYSIKDTNGDWQKPRNLGKPINSAYDEVSIKVNSDYSKASITSSRDGGDDDIYLMDLPMGLLNVLRWNYSK